MYFCLAEVYSRMKNNLSSTGNVLCIKNMVCPRCIMAVRQCLETLNLHPQSVELGMVLMEEPLTDELRHRIGEALAPLGFELLDKPGAQLVEQIKIILIDLVHYHNEPLKSNLSQYLADKLHRDYSSLSKLFSETTGTTIEKYFIAQKIERVKELIVYGELSLNEIADRLGYSSVAYLSSQFKSVTGLTPGYFKRLKENRRKALDEIL